jgi:hypothetical protein
MIIVDCSIARCRNRSISLLHVRWNIGSGDFHSRLRNKQVSEKGGREERARRTTGDNAGVARGVRSDRTLLFLVVVAEIAVRAGSILESMSSSAMVVLSILIVTRLHDFSRECQYEAPRWKVMHCLSTMLWTMLHPSSCSYVLHRGIQAPHLNSEQHQRHASRVCGERWDAATGIT